MEGQSRRCDECESRCSMTAMRRCITCVRDIGRHISVGCTLDCVVCLECCVDRHNGHELTSLAARSSSSVTDRPVASSTPLFSTPRYIHGNASTSDCQIAEQVNIGSQNPSSTATSIRDDRPRVPVAVTTTESEVVFLEESPLYYHLPVEKVSYSEVMRRSSSCSGKADCSGISSTKQNVSDDPHEMFYPSNSSTSACSSSSTDDSLYRKVSMNCTQCKLRQEDAQSLSPTHHYVNVSRLQSC
ncbi:hypothetical protein OESDEN_06728 [Oesophagostomum dentatum]|uniref:Uncharacterized protein n=1 Tax=Oesophagostomum dentatum TaxID=61180 RepID=A0A0B1TDC5_OESDE|nr:hypothetical protein OESDEN_06728 [Oesophagostomum dentatum]